VASQIDRTAKGLSPVAAPPSTPAFVAPRTGWARAEKKNEDGAIRRASAKLQEGDIRGAARCLSSEDKGYLTRPSAATRNALLEKHPPQPVDRRIAPVPSVQPMTVTAMNVKLAIRSFAPGSAGGRDGLRPQHLKDMSDDRVGGSLCESLAEFANLVLAGGVPDAVKPIFFGA
jgi:hypothetical protein